MFITIEDKKQACQNFYFEVDRLPLPKCSYINTDFPGDDLVYEDGVPGINAGSARACKARCKQEESCFFWTYKEGANRDTVTKDCFLKEGTPGKSNSVLLNLNI